MKHGCLALGMVCLALFGCANKREPDLVRVAVFGALENYHALDARVDAFNREGRGFRLKLELAPQGVYYDKLLVQSAAGMEADVVWMTPEALPLHLEGGLLLPLDPLLAKDPLDMKAFESGVAARFQRQGTLWAVPHALAVDSLVYCNTGMFKAAGLALPAGDWTWADLRKAAAALTKRGAGGRVAVWGYAEQGGPDLPAALYANGAGLVDDEDAPKRCTLDDPKAVAAARFLADLMLGDKTMPVLGRDVEGGAEPDLFKAGQIAMLRGQPELAPALAAVRGLTWTAMRAPLGPATTKPAYPARATGWAITRHTLKPEQAWAAVKALSTPQAQGAMLPFQPSLVSLLKSDAFLAGLPGPVRRHAAGAARQARFGPYHPRWREAWVNYILPPTVLAWTGKQDPETALKQAASEVNRFLWDAHMGWVEGSGQTTLAPSRALMLSTTSLIK